MGRTFFYKIEVKSLNIRAPHAVGERAPPWCEPLPPSTLVAPMYEYVGIWGTPTIHFCGCCALCILQGRWYIYRRLWLFCVTTVTSEESTWNPIGRSESGRVISWREHKTSMALLYLKGRCTVGCSKNLFNLESRWLLTLMEIWLSALKVADSYVYTVCLFWFLALAQLRHFWWFCHVCEAAKMDARH
jgi:hypothetical protein